ncbi:MAG TPA: FHA domain-containing protein [Terriglobales bacterium]|nr:FHA domain-containing protein [Terriglobales bacterium]
MAKLYLKFEQAVLKEYELKDGSSMTIGRLPDNNVHIDNLAVSGHHARLVWENDHFVLEDNNSLNGTFVNNRRINRAALKHGDVILIGKHTISYWDEVRGETGEPHHAEAPSAPVPQLEATMVLDTRKAKEMIGQQAAGAGAAAAPAKERIGQLQVMHGKTDQQEYVLSGKLTVIGKSDMASIKLKGWFAPKVAAVINKRENKYFIAASEKDVRVKVNDSEISGPTELTHGDLIEVAKVKLTFSYAE